MESSFTEMPQAVVIGGGLSGLAAALMLQRSGFSNITVLEKRANHSRDNQILLSHLGACRLRQLGVYAPWQKAFQYHDSAHSEGAVTRGEGIEVIARQMKDSGRLPLDAPEDHVRFVYDTSPDEVIRVCRELGLHIEDEKGIVTAFENVTPEMVVDVQQRGLGIENVKIKELEQTMVKVCLEHGVKIVYNCGDIQLVLSPARDSIINVRTNNGVSIASPSLVVDCEGARRVIAKQQLQLREVRSTKTQWFAMFLIEKYYGPVAYTVINARDSNYSSARLRHFLVANFQTRQQSLCAMQLPPQFVGALDEDDNGEMLKQYCQRHLALLTEMHGLETPPGDFTIKWQPFECRETYLASPCFGDNLIVMGDAARSGTFLSGTGYNLALVNDLNAVESLALKVIHKGRVTQQEVAKAGASIEHTSNVFHQLNLNRYY